MEEPNYLEEAYLDFVKNFKTWAPDGILEIGLEQLCEMGLLNKDDLDEDDADDVTHYFHVVETPDKITLYNEKFVVWVVPKTIESIPTTLTYISKVNQNKPELELVFSTAGVYNTPKFILKILQHFLIEVIDTDNIISSIGKKN